MYIFNDFSNVQKWPKQFYQISWISTTEKNYDSFSGDFEIANQVQTHHSLYLVPWMNGKVFSFWNVKKDDDFLLVRCFYSEQNNTWLLGDNEFLFECSNTYRHK